MRAGALALTAASLASGCQGAAATREGADAASGKEVFTKNCGSCHTLADAGSKGELGPNLDDAFGPARAQGFDDSTFFEIALEQMRIPAPPMPDFDEGKTKLSETELRNVAHYLATCAGLGEKKRRECSGPAEGPQAVFAATCGGCHTLAAAGTTGTTGPNLDEAKPSLEESIRQIRNGGGGMPAFAGDLSDGEIRAIARYVVESAGK